MGRYNRKLVETTMTWEVVAQQLEEIYRQTLQKAAFTRHGHQRREVLALDAPSVSEAQERVWMRVSLVGTTIETTRLGYGCASLMGRLQPTESWPPS